MTKPASQDCYLIKKRDLENGYFSYIFENYRKAKSSKPGQFVQIDLPSTDIFFRRPMSIADVDVERNFIEVIFKVVGKGTVLLSQLRKGDRVNILGPLGNSFEKPSKKEDVIIVAGGVGFPPLMFFTKFLIVNKYDPQRIHFFYGGRSKPDILEINRIKKTGVNFYPVTEDGSLGIKGLVTQPLDKIFSGSKQKLRIYSCGPVGMLKAVDELAIGYKIPGQLSLEAPMPCGIGICLGCMVPLKEGGYSRVCCDGPVYNTGEVVL